MGLGEVTVELATRMVDEVGARPAGSPEAIDAQDWVEEELRRAGWNPDRRALGGWQTTWACRRGPDARIVLFLAHTDTVWDAPGANDNAAAVASLLVAARHIPHPPRRTVCLAFPDGEEPGLQGSRAFARAALHSNLLGGPVDQVVSLDLVGSGRLTHNGLGPTWGEARLRELIRAAPAEAPWVYRAVSWAWPAGERSDHAPFAWEGVPASHLMARGPSGVTWTYHTPQDTPDTLDPATLARAVRVVRRIARGHPMPPEPAGPALVAPGGHVVPAWAVRLGSALGVAAGLHAGLGVDRSTLRAMGSALLAGMAFAVVAFVATGGRWMGATLATPVLAAAWAAWGAVVLAWPLPASRRGARALAAVPAALALAVWASPFDAILALPLACSAAAIAVGGGRLAPLLAPLALWPAIYLVRPDAVRELAFHQLVPAHPLLWGATHLLLAGPAVGLVMGATRTPRRPLLAALLALLAVGALVNARYSPELAPPYRSPWWRDSSRTDPAP